MTEHSGLERWPFSHRIPDLPERRLLALTLLAEKADGNPEMSFAASHDGRSKNLVRYAGWLRKSEVQQQGEKARNFEDSESQ